MKGFELLGVQNINGKDLYSLGLIETSNGKLNRLNEVKLLSLSKLKELYSVLPVINMEIKGNRVLELPNAYTVCCNVLSSINKTSDRTLRYEIISSRKLKNNEYRRYHIKVYLNELNHDITSPISLMSKGVGYNWELDENNSIIFDYDGRQPIEQLNNIIDDCIGKLMGIDKPQWFISKTPTYTK